MFSAGQVLSIARRYARHHPLDLVAMSLSLALGMLLLVLVLAAINGFLLRPLEVPGLEDLVRVREVRSAPNGQRDVFSVAPATWNLWREAKPRSFVDIGVATGGNVTLGLSDAPEQREAALVSANFLPLLGVQPQLGRFFTADADLGAGADEILIGNNLWRDGFASDPAVIGRVVHVDGRARKIIGVMPAAISFPYNAEVWLPIALGDRLDRRVGNYLFGLARLRPGASTAMAEQELGELTARLKIENASLVESVGVELTPLREELVGNLRPALKILSTASALAFLVALLNCATLTGLRALRDRPTVALRAALGAGLRDLAGEAFVRHLCTAVVAGTLSLLALGPLSGPLLGLAGSASINEFDVAPRADLGTLALTALVALAATVLLTIVEAATLAMAVRRPALIRETRMTHGRATGRLLRMVTVGQMVVGIVVVTAALLVTGGYLEQVYGNRGFAAEGLWLVDVSLPSTRFADTPQRLRYIDEVVERLRGVPGVASAGAVTVTPDEAGSWGAAYVLPGQEPPAIGYHLTNHRLVGSGYFGALGIPLLSGRDFGSADFAPDARSVIVSREFAARSWPGQEPLGRQVRRLRSDQLLTVVGVAGDVREAQQAEDWNETATWYLPASLGTDYDFGQITFAIRLAGEGGTQLPAALAAIRQVDPSLALADVARMTDRLSVTYEREVYTSRLFAAFALVSLLIAAIGTYALLAFIVASKHAEHGLRLALGERPAVLVRRLWVDAAAVLLAGIAFGVPLSWAAARYLSSQLQDLPDWSVQGCAIAVAVCVLLQLAAVVGPSRRAWRASPLALLRSG